MSREILPPSRETLDANPQSGNQFHRYRVGSAVVAHRSFYVLKLSKGCGRRPLPIDAASWKRVWKSLGTPLSDATEGEDVAEGTAPRAQRAQPASARGVRPIVS